MRDLSFDFTKIQPWSCAREKLLFEIAVCMISSVNSWSESRGFQSIIRRRVSISPEMNGWHDIGRESDGLLVKNQPGSGKFWRIEYPGFSGGICGEFA
jgi:hypothetical protein